MYLLDTDIQSNLLRPRPSPVLLAKLRAISAEQRFTSSITVGELLYGAHRLREGRERLLHQIETKVLAGLEVLPFDVEAARIYGQLRAQLEADGTPIGDADTRIAAIALAHNLTVVTANLRHFARIPGLPVENWL